MQPGQIRMGRGGGFGDRFRFSGQQGFVGEKPVCLPDDTIPYGEINRAAAIAENASNETEVIDIFAQMGVGLYGDQ